MTEPIKGGKMKWRFICCMAMAAAIVATAAYADDGELFRKDCGACHQKGGQAPPVNPADKAAVVWEKFFDRNRHPVDLSSKISEADLKSIIQYLQKYAADSDRPETAAIPK